METLYISREPLSQSPYWPYLSTAAVLTDFEAHLLAPLHGASTDASVVGSMLMDHGEPIRIGPAKGRWTLSDRSRSAALAELKRQDGLLAALRASYGCDRPDNPTQRAVDKMIEQGSPPPLGTQTLAELLGVHRVTELLRPIMEPVPGFQEELSERIERLRLLEPLQRLLEMGFAGRVKELAVLRSYVDELESAGLGETLMRSLDNVLDIFRTRPPLVIWGPGGVGKSTLIARFLMDHAGPQVARPVPFVYLDCDQSDLDPLRPDSLLTEALRQIQVQFPKFADQAAHLEADSATRMGSEDIRVISRSGHFEQSHDLRERFAELVSDISAAKGSRSVLFFIDTFEVVQRRGSAPIYNVLKLCAQLMQLTTHLRVVIASRVCLRDSDFNAYAEKIPRWKPLPLKGFDAAAGRMYLENRLGRLGKHGLAPATLDRIVSLVHGNPLSLRLGAQVFARIGVGALEDAVDEATFDAELIQERLQGELHNRILLNLDDRVRNVADPGLIVRRLTPEIIEMVLDQACGLGIRDRDDAEALFQHLREEQTLFEVAGEEALRHRPDVRLLMLPLLRTKLGALARQIDMAAVRFWSGKNDAEARAEEIYHLLWLDAGPGALDEVWSRGPVSRALMEDTLDEFEALDGSVQARIWLCRKLEREISPVLEHKADQADWERNAERRARSLLANGAALEALAALRGRAGRSDASPLWELEIEALKLLARDGEAQAVVEQALQRAVGSHAPQHVVALLLQKAWLLERAKNLPGAFDIAGHAARLAAELGDAPMRFEAMLTQARVGRTMNDATRTEPLRQELVRLLDDPVVRERVQQRPALLREATAELGGLRPELFIWAVSRSGRRGSDPRADAAALLTVGVAHVQRAELAEAEEALAQARDIAVEIGDDALQARALLQLANVHLDRYDLTQAMRCLDHALMLARGGGDLALELQVKSALGNFQARTGDFGGAVRHYSRSLEMARASGDRTAESNALANLANGYIGMGAWDQATPLIAEASLIAEELGDQHVWRQALGSQATVHWKKGELLIAAMLFNRSLGAARQLGDIRGVCVTLTNLGGVYAERNELDLSERYLREAVELSRQIGDPLAEFNALGSLGHMFRKAGDMVRARIAYNEQLKAADRTADRRRTDAALHNLKQLANDAKDPSAAEGQAPADEDASPSPDGVFDFSVSQEVSERWFTELSQSVESARESTDSLVHQSLPTKR